MTPAEFSDLRRVWKEAREREKRNAAAIIATLHNAFFKSDGLPWTEDDLMTPGHRDKRRARKVAEKVRQRTEAIKQKHANTESEIPEWALQLKKARPN